MSHKATHTIHVTGKAHYARLTHDVIDTIMSNAVGRIIVHGIRDTGKDVTVHKRTDEERDDNACNAETHAKPREDAFMVGDSRTLYNGNSDDPDTRKDERFERVKRGFKGTGKGSDVVIHFDPDDTEDCDSTRPTADHDDILIHELVHALRATQGLMNFIPTADHNYENDEEYLAVVVTNVYASAKGGHHFRANHHGHHLLRHSLSTSAGFIQDIHNFRLLRKYRRDWLETFAALARVKTHFNPFREMLHYSSNAMSPMAHRSHELQFQQASPSH
jgi:hypothetical protein